MPRHEASVTGDVARPPYSEAMAAARRPTQTAPYRCTECGWTTIKWVGRCGECQQWGTVVEAAEQTGITRSVTPVSPGAGRAARPHTPHDPTAAPRRFAGGLHGRQEQGDEHADDGNDHEQFDERETAPARQRPRHDGTPPKKR